MVLSRVSIALATVALVAGGCGRDIPAPDADQAPPPAPTTTAPVEDPEPASAVLAYVPAETTTVTVPDFDRVALQLGVDLSSDLTGRERKDFWQRAETETALLARGQLRADEDLLLADYGFGQEDVGWEARLFDAEGNETGWVLGFHDTTDMTKVQEAIEAGVVSLAGAEIVDGSIVVNGELPDADASWAADDTMSSLVGLPTNATYLERGCVPAPEGALGLDELDAYSLSLEGTVATARLGPGRTDLFARMRLGEQLESFATGFGGGVADPLSGRIGYQLVSPPAAADLALRRQLPFAACGD